MTPQEKFTEIAVVVPWEASDAVENFLVESGALGASIEQLDLKGSTATVRGYFSGVQRIAELEASVRAYLSAIQDYFPSPEKRQFSTRILQDEDWQEQWKLFFKPIRVTRRIVVKPSWEAYEARPEEIVIEIDPGMAFGTGLHATTRLCLEVIETEVDRRMRQSDENGGTEISLLDVGTGSGILAIAAARLGARPVVGIDIDETAIEVARQNVGRNRVDQTVRIGSENLEAIDGYFDLVVANIDLPTLFELKELLVSHVSQGGRLILSGILRNDRKDLKWIYRRRGLQFFKEKTREGWCCLIYERP